MLFNSLDFAVFLPIVFLLYWSLNKFNIKYQNLLILISSYLFYGWWDFRFLFLILLSTIVDFSIGLLLDKEKEISKRKILLWTSILVNLGLLCLFKYYNFFQQNFVDVFSFFGYKINYESLDLILPVGISFYTFQTLSYTIDIYKNKLKPTKDILSFAAFVAFFPQLVAGPIERATHLLPQFYKRRSFNYSLAVDGARQILWGLFKKIVIADNCATYANMIFNNYSEHTGSELAFGALFFTIQIYGDFSGYSDIAIGTSKLFGFDLMKNFSFPYFSRDIAEFWRKWHISLSTWFRDYLYIPLGGSKGSLKQKIRNTFIVFLVSGFWHGANWTFIVWGLLNAIYFLPLLITKKNRRNIDTVSKGQYLPTLIDFFKMLLTFILTIFAWIFFRAENITHAFLYIKGIFSKSFFSIPRFESSIISTKIMLILILFFFIIEWFQREKNHGLEFTKLNSSKVFRWITYYIIVFFIIYFGGGKQEFIYFQF
jgi:D-alanyl-lipoteichoic acid acyltransferase DltB (MBOAT superfamily)